MTMLLLDWAGHQLTYQIAYPGRWVSDSKPMEVSHV
jgi:hypothetical protein